jgi:hypothetical protein
MLEWPKLLNFKIGGPILQNNENRWTKTVIKLLKFDIWILFIHNIFGWKTEEIGLNYLK